MSLRLQGSLSFSAQAALEEVNLEHHPVEDEGRGTSFPSLTYFEGFLDENAKAGEAQEEVDHGFQGST